MRQLLLLLLFEDSLGRGARSIGVRWGLDDEDLCVRLVPARKPPLRRYALIDGRDTTMMATAISAIDSTTVELLVSIDWMCESWLKIALTDIRPCLYHFDRRVTSHAHGDSNGTQRERGDQANNLTSIELQLVEQREWEDTD